jgi:hypothetical protein
MCPACLAKAKDEALRAKKTKEWQYVFIQDIATGKVERL